MNSLRLLLVITFWLLASGNAYSLDKLTPKDIPANMKPMIKQDIVNLFSNDPVERAKSAKKLGQKGNTEVLPFLYSILDDTASLKWTSNPIDTGFVMVGETRTTPGIEAAISIWRIGKDEQFEKMISIIEKNENQNISSNLIRAMREINIPQASDFLISIAVNDLDKKENGRGWMWEQAVSVLSFKNDQKANKTLLQLSKHNDPEVRSEALYSIVSSYKNRDREIVTEAMLRGLDDNNVKVRKTVSFYLMFVQDKTLLPVLLHLVRSEQDTYILGNVIEALGKLKDKEAVGALMELLQFANKKIRADSARALGAIGDKNAFNPLIELLLNDEDDNVRCSVAKALGMFGDTKAVGPLITVTKQVSQGKGMMKYEGPKALKSITGQDFEYDINKYEQWWNKNKHLYQNKS